jgi:hypothetical protein
MNGSCAPAVNAVARRIAVSSPAKWIALPVKQLALIVFHMI